MIVQVTSNSIGKVVNLLTPEAMQAMEQATKEIKFSGKNSSILDEKSDDLRLIKSVKFKLNNVANNEILNVVEEWGFEKDKKSSDPN